MSEHPLNPHAMTNSHILVHEFDYFEPASLHEAMTLLARYGEGARLVAGGTHLLVLMKMEREAPQALISLQKVRGLDGIRLEPDGSLWIGPCATLRSILVHPAIRTRYTALAQACATFGSTQVQMMGTIGGNLCNGSPAADTVPPLLAFNTQLQIASLTGSRDLPLEDFLLGPGKVALGPTEILSGIRLPPPPDCSTSLFFKLTRVSSDLAKASLAIVLSRQDEKITALRLAMGSVAPKVMRLRPAEAWLVGKRLTPELAVEAGRLGSQAISPIDDTRSTAWYRRQVAEVMVRDALEQAWQKAVEPAQPSLSSLPPVKHAASQGTRGAGAMPSAPQNVQRGKTVTVTLTVNGRKERLAVAPNELLLNVLRERLELTGTKYSCGIGECSACTVHIDGKPALSCLVLAVAADGKEITTIEGLQDPGTGRLDPLQQSFIDNGGFQCGFCTPGMIMTAKSLLNENPHPSEAEVRAYLKGNHCRCTGYASIVRSVLGAVKS